MILFQEYYSNSDSSPSKNFLHEFQQELEANEKEAANKY